MDFGGQLMRHYFIFCIGHAEIWGDSDVKILCDLDGREQKERREREVRGRR
jgi:hypothetical protein